MIQIRRVRLPRRECQSIHFQVVVQITVDQRRNGYGNVVRKFRVHFKAKGISGSLSISSRRKLLYSSHDLAPLNTASVFV
jgi:hypothetical protein